nr:MAG TPA: hypothetical protein [Caudoviricetes sp.]
MCGRLVSCTNIRPNALLREAGRISLTLFYNVSSILSMLLSR